MAKERNKLSWELITMLQTSPFLPGMEESSTLRDLTHFIDPQSPIATLFPFPSPDYTVLQEEPAVIQNLRLLDVLPNSLSPAIVNNRVCWIASIAETELSTAANVSEELLKQLSSSNFEVSMSDISSDKKWIITTGRTLMHQSECRDAPVDLFDQVWGVVPLSLSTLLRKSLGWNMPIPTPVLFSQLDKVVQLQRRQPIKAVIKVLSRTLLSEDEISDLRNLMGKRAWIPTLNHGLSSSSRTLFYNSQFASLPGFQFIEATKGEGDFLGRVIGGTR
jgi:hypothetical protein